MQEKLLGSKSSQDAARLEELETILDVFNITMNRDLAESAAKARRAADAANASGGGFFSWFWGSKKVN